MRINPIRSFIDIIDTKNATAKATASIIIAPLVSAVSVLIKKSENSKSFIALAPKIAGTAAKKENSVALFLSRPIILAPRMVAPERDVPGIIASA